MTGPTASAMIVGPLLHHYASQRVVSVPLVANKLFKHLQTYPFPLLKLAIITSNEKKAECGAGEVCDASHGPCNVSFVRLRNAIERKLMY